MKSYDTELPLLKNSCKSKENDTQGPAACAGKTCVKIGSKTLKGCVRISPHELIHSLLVTSCFREREKEGQATKPQPEPCAKQSELILCRTRSHTPCKTNEKHSGISILVVKQIGMRVCNGIPTFSMHIAPRTMRDSCAGGNS